MATLLPSELLVQIFKDLRNMFAQRGETDHELDPLKWLPVNRVCRFWRQASLGDPTLWTHISMWNDNLECVRTFVERSRPQPLHVFVPVEGSGEETNNRNALRLAMGEAHRVRHLEVGRRGVIQYRGDDARNLNEVFYIDILCRCAFPALQELCLSHVDIEPPSLVALLAACPELRKLIVTVSGLSWSDGASCPTVEMWCDALAKMPHLEHLLLERAFESESGLEQTPGGDDIRSPLRLDRLKTLSIYYPPLQQSVWFFHSLSIPSTASVHVKYDGLDDTSQDTASVFAAIAACRSRNRKCKLISLDLDESYGESLEVSCWDTTFQMPLCSREPYLLTEDMRTHLLLRISLSLAWYPEDRRGLHIEIADMLRDAFILTDAVSIRIASRWFEQDSDLDEPGAAELAAPSTQAYRVIFNEMIRVKTLLISRDTSSRQIDCMLGMDLAALNSSVQPSVPPPFPHLEELALHNMCLWSSWEIPCEIPYAQLLRAINVRKTMGCGIWRVRIRDMQDGELEGPVYAQLCAAVPELDVQRSSTCTCSEQVVDLA
ncbi:hypothetical protein NM688_g124 [Phlebia brevispora]|uniref:Uncharacterized protein n=1 Tax=Phlebia brevispora TaxID=194682 RepID=A0ACC1TF70_9APHY|nr:hypothetical protein NM688_g124 [Phlebia brevispora]